MNRYDFIDWLHTLAFMIAMYYAYRCHMIGVEIQKISKEINDGLGRLLIKLNGARS